MRVPLRIALCAAIFAAAALFAADPAWPNFEGEVAADFLATFLPDPPALKCKVTLGRSQGARQQLLISADGEGTRIRVQAEIDLSTRDGEWRVLEATFDATRWVGRAAARFAATPGLMGKGAIGVTGSGILRAGRPSGTAQFTWRAGELADLKAGWSLQGIEVTGDVAFDAATGAIHSVAPARITVRTISTKRFGARNLTVVASLGERRTVALSEGKVEIAGGNAWIAPCEFPLEPLRIETEVSFSRVGLQDIVALVPEILVEGRGRVDGTVRLAWAPHDNFTIGAGSLSLSPRESAEVRLAPTPGLITSNLTPTILKYYPGLDEIELGRTPLLAEALRVTFTPEGDAEGRTATINLAGKGKNGLAPVDLTVNVRGPVEPLLRLGMRAKGLHFGGK